MAADNELPLGVSELSAGLLRSGRAMESQSFVQSSPLSCAVLIKSFRYVCRRALSSGDGALIKALCVYLRRESGHPDGRWTSDLAVLGAEALGVTRVKATAGGGVGCCIEPGGGGSIVGGGSVGGGSWG